MRLENVNFVLVVVRIYNWKRSRREARAQRWFKTRRTRRTPRLLLEPPANAAILACYRLRASRIDGELRQKPRHRQQVRAPARAETARDQHVIERCHLRQAVGPQDAVFPQE